MKTNNPNVLFNHQTKILFEKTSQVMKQKLLLMLLLVFVYSGSFAQGSRMNGTIIVKDMNSILYSGGTARQAASSSALDVTRLRDLVAEVQSSMYFYGSEVKTYGDAPTNLFTDLSSLNQVNNSIILKQNVEIVTIRIKTASELNSTIDFAVFSNFPNLKYIYFISGLNTTSENIASHISNYDNRYNIFYTIEKGDGN
jgi:hypothetical protein